MARRPRYVKALLSSTFGGQTGGPFPFVYIKLVADFEYVVETTYGLERNNAVAPDGATFSLAYNEWGNPQRGPLVERNGVIYRPRIWEFEGAFPVTENYVTSSGTTFDGVHRIYGSPVEDPGFGASLRYAEYSHLDGDRIRDAYLYFVAGDENEAALLGISDYWLDPADAPLISSDTKMPTQLGQSGGGAWIGGSGSDVFGGIPLNKPAEKMPEKLELPDEPNREEAPPQKSDDFPWWILLVAGSFFLEG